MMMMMLIFILQTGPLFPGFMVLVADVVLRNLRRVFGSIIPDRLLL